MSTSATPDGLTTDRVPKLFVGCSSEGMVIAKRLVDLLAPEVEAQLWTEGFFGAGEFTLESLEERTQSYDGGLIVGTSDDRVVSRGEEFDCIRDNLLIEYGMFVAAFGHRRALLALERVEGMKLPSDLLGLTCVAFEKTDSIDRGLERAVTDIKRAVAAFPSTPVDPVVMEGLSEVLQVFLYELQAALGARDVGFHCWVVDPRFVPARLVRVARARTSQRNRLDRVYAEGEGVIGEVWRTASSAKVDFRQNPYATATPDQWAVFGPPVRLGMSHQLLTESRERYRAIGATPIKSDLRSGSGVLGCLSYNVGPNIDNVGYAPCDAQVEFILDKVAELVRIILQSTI